MGAKNLSRSCFNVLRSPSTFRIFVSFKEPPAFASR
jgi:hypothetical protein